MMGWQPASESCSAGMLGFRSMQMSDSLVQFAALVVPAVGAKTWTPSGRGVSLVAS